MTGISLTHKILVAWLILATHATAQSSSRLSSRFLARGEQALLEVAVTGARPDAFPIIPEIPGIEIRQTGRGPQTKLLTGRRLEHVFEYIVSSYEIGNHVLPSLDVTSGGTTSRTEPIEFSVFNPDELQWTEAASGATGFRYATAFRTINPRPFLGETSPVEIKLYVPSDLFVEDWGIPDFQRDGLTAWRFQPSAMRGQVNLLGKPHIAVAYPSTLTPTRTGTIGIGPATVRLIIREQVMDGILRLVSREQHLTVPGLELQSLELPAGAPAGFDNAVGNFSIKVSTALTDVSEGDPLPVEIVVSGSGNLDTLHPPKPVDSSGWKTYDPTDEQRGDERRELSGTRVFRQFLRPLEMKSAIPAFELVYFDPRARAYKTALSTPIPLSMRPAPAAAAQAAGFAPPEALATPVERMTDILGLLDTAQITLPKTSQFPGWLGHLIGALIALGLIFKAVWMRVGHRFRKDPARNARLESLREVEKLVDSSADEGFLLAAGRFIESWLGPNPPAEVQSILVERDSRCFRQNRSANTPLDPKMRRTMLSALRKSVLTFGFLIVLCGGGTEALAESPAEQARTAYDAAKYDEAINHWLKAADYEDLSADVLYNIGNACYRAGSPGHSALYYRRALARNPGHQEARQNLRFIERKYGAITVRRPEFQYAIARIPLASWQTMLWSGLWLSGLAILVFPATHPANRLRALAVVALVFAPLVAAFGALGWRYFPTDAEFSQLSRQAVIVVADAKLHAEASRTSPEVIDAPPGSLCEVIRESERWAYVAFASETRGWIPIEAIEKITPETTPTPPKIRKPKADGKSA